MSDSEPNTQSPAEWGVTSWSLGKINSLGLMGVFLLLVIGFRIKAMNSFAKYIKIFEDFDTELPELTQFALTEWFFLPLYLLVAFCVAKEILIKNRKVTSTLNWFLVWTIPVYQNIYAHAMFIPMVKLIESVS